MAIYVIANNNQYKIIGRTSSFLNGKKVMLFKFRNEKVSNIDSALILNSNFHFHGKVDTATFAVLTCGNFPDSVWSAKLMLEPGEINVLLSKPSYIGGTLLNNIFQAYIEKCATLQDSINMIQKRSEMDSISLISLHDLRIKLNEFEKSFILKNSSNLLGVILLRARCESGYSDGFFEIYNKSDSLLKNDFYVKRFAQCYEYEEQKEKERMEVRKKLEGQSYKDFIFFTTSGDMIKLSDLVNNKKYTLIVFWASWCSPCMAEQPIIKEIYETYKDKGLDVIGISLDENNQAWKSAINKVQPTWIQLRDMNEGKSGLKDAYGFAGIPYHIIIDRNGKIMAPGIPAVILKQFIKPLLENN
jgi:thiol-disulfide isomerase/thioredoxin